MRAWHMPCLRATHPASDSFMTQSWLLLLPGATFMSAESEHFVSLVQEPRAGGWGAGALQVGGFPVLPAAACGAGQDPWLQLWVAPGVVSTAVTLPSVWVPALPDPVTLAEAAARTPRAPG